jgi:hypothetical protein
MIEEQCYENMAKGTNFTTMAEKLLTKCKILHGMHRLDIFY